jgi:Spy/CpxP family protein refolding chaperone
MNSLSKNKWQGRAAAAVIFMIGFAVGILALNVYRGWAARGDGPPRDRVEQLAERLQLNAAQKAKVQQILGDTREQLRALRKESEPKVSEIRQQADQKMQQVLNADQWKQFQTMREEMRQRRSKRAEP